MKKCVDDPKPDALAHEAFDTDEQGKVPSIAIRGVGTGNVPLRKSLKSFEGNALQIYVVNSLRTTSEAKSTSFSVLKI